MSYSNIKSLIIPFNPSPLSIYTGPFVCCYVTVLFHAPIAHLAGSEHVTDSLGLCQVSNEFEAERRWRCEALDADDGVKLCLSMCIAELGTLKSALDVSVRLATASCDASDPSCCAVGFGTRASNSSISCIDLTHAACPICCAIDCRKSWLKVELRSLLSIEAVVLRTETYSFQILSKCNKLLLQRRPTRTSPSSNDSGEELMPDIVSISWLSLGSDICRLWSNFFDACGPVTLSPHKSNNTYSLSTKYAERPSESSASNALKRC